MATFYANPTEETEIWIERAAIEGYGFRIWHVIFFCFAGFTAVMILICCCIKIRIPRTKQEIEADYRRKKLADKFRERLKLIQNQDMDAIDLQQALAIIQEDYRIEKEMLINTLPADLNVNTQNSRNEQHFMVAEPQEPTTITFAQKLSNVMKISKLSSTQSSK